MFKTPRPRLIELFNNMFSIFKQYYTHFHTLFYLHVFQKNTNNVTRTTLPNNPQVFHNICPIYTVITKQPF